MKECYGESAQVYDISKQNYAKRDIITCAEQAFQANGVGSWMSHKRIPFERH
jgi:hypothetical protein